MKRVTLVTKTDDGYLIRCKLGKKKWANFIVVPDEGTSENSVLSLAIALADSVE